MEVLKYETIWADDICCEVPADFHARLVEVSCRYMFRLEQN